jgi:hypothetical protein
MILLIRYAAHLVPSGWDAEQALAVLALGAAAACFIVAGWLTHTAHKRL